MNNETAMHSGLRYELVGEKVWDVIRQGKPIGRIQRIAHGETLAFSPEDRISPIMIGELAEISGFISRGGNAEHRLAQILANVRWERRTENSGGPQATLNLTLTDGSDRNGLPLLRIGQTNEDGDGETILAEITDPNPTVNVGSMFHEAGSRIATAEAAR